MSLRRPANYHEYPPHMLRRAYLLAMRQGTRLSCGICNGLIHFHDPLGRLTIDHIVPRSKGGSDDYDNLQPAHLKCNQAKADVEPLIVFEVYHPQHRPVSLQNQNA